VGDDGTLSPARRVDAPGPCSLAGPSSAPAMATLWNRCRGVREESIPGRRMLEIKACGHWVCTVCLYAFAQELGGTTPQPATRDFDAEGSRSAPPTTPAAHRIERAAVGALGDSLLSAHRFDAPKRSLAGSTKDGGDGSSTGIAARAIRRTRKKAGLSRPQGRAATVGRDGSDRTAASAQLNVSRETLSSGTGAAYSGGLWLITADSAALIHLTGARHLVR
jgi:hypothetical protein